MKYIFLAIFVGLLGMSVAAWRMIPPPDRSGKKVIVWASDDNPSRRDQIALFNKLHPAYKLQLDSVNNGMDKVITQSLSGVGPDVFDSNTTQVALLADAGLLYDVTDQLKARGITLDQIWPLARPAVAIKGRIYGIPCNVSGNAIWYHKDIFDEEHIPYPPAKGWKWDDFVAVAKKLTKRDAQGHVIRYGVMGLNYMDLIYTNGGRVLTPDGRKCVIDSPECIDGVQKWADLQLKYDVSPTPDEEASMATQGGWGSGTITLFQDKRAAMAAGGRWWLCSLRLVKDEGGNFPFNLGVAEKPITHFARYTGAARVAYVNALSPHRDWAVEFLAYLCSDAYSDALNEQADGIPAMIKASNRKAYDYDPYHGRDGANSPIWKDLARTAINGELSPYITPTEISNILSTQMDQVRSGTKPVAAALHEAAQRINQKIATNVARDPELRKRYDNGDTSAVYGNFTDASLAATTRPAATSDSSKKDAPQAQ